MTLKELLISWAKQVISSEKGHCEKEKWACMRFLRDVERENTEEFPYYFDNEAGLRFLEWMAKFKHTKGYLAGTYIDPVPIQMFIFGNLYGWKRVKDGTRRFRLSYWQVARKNAKTQSNACVASYEMSALGEPNAEVYIGATQTDQAKILWNETYRQIMNSDFKDKFEKSYGNIVHTKSGSITKALSKEAGKTGDGLSPQAGLVDEYHAHQTSEIYDVLLSGMAARPQPLLSIITTAGFDLNNPCYSVEYKYVSNILNPDSDVENDEYFVMINELDPGDDVKDESNWLKANPIVASNEKGLDYLRGQLKLALESPEKMRGFLTKNMNVWVDMPEAGYIDMKKWNENVITKEEFNEFAKNPHAKNYIGFDLSMTTDLTAISLVSEKDGEYRVIQYSFMPRERYNERMAIDKIRFDVYHDRGELILCDGATINQHEVKLKILELAKEYNVQEICYDPYQSALLVYELEQEGYTLVTIPQNIMTLSEPTKRFRENLYQGKVKHCEDRLLRWCMGNAILQVDDKENIKISKKKSKDRIDPVDAIINAFLRAQAGRMETDLEEYFLSDDFSF